MRPWPGDAAGVADGRDRHAEGPAQRLRVSGPGAPGRGVTRRGARAHRGGSRLWRSEALPGADRGVEVDFVIRFRGNIMVTAADGEARAAADWVGAGGGARVLRRATVTAAGYEVGAVVCVQAKGMKEPWCLAVSTVAEPARALINLYAKRWGIECAFRDTKDLRFGMGMSAMHISTPDRRDRL